MDTLCKCSRHWQWACGVPKLGATLGEAANARRKRRRKRAGGGPRAEGVGEKGLQCWGHQDHPHASHICILGLSPLPRQQGQAPICQQSYQCFRWRSIGCDAPVCPCNNREHGLLRETEKPTCPQGLGRGLGIPPSPGPHAPTPAPRPFPFLWGAAPPYLTSAHLPA